MPQKRWICKPTFHWYFKWAQLLKKSTTEQCTNLSLSLPSNLQYFKSFCLKKLSHWLLEKLLNLITILTWYKTYSKLCRLVPSCPCFRPDRPRTDRGFYVLWLPRKRVLLLWNYCTARLFQLYRLYRSEINNKKTVVRITFFFVNFCHHMINETKEL